MTKSIIEIAREAAASKGHTLKDTPEPETLEFIEAFATAIKAAHLAELAGVEMTEPRVWEYTFLGTPETTQTNWGWIRLTPPPKGCKEVGLVTLDQCQQAVASAVAREREACAVACEDEILNYSEKYVLDGCAKAIRARSNT